MRESKGKGWYLIDCGEGTQHQVLHTKLSFHSLKAILITHVHGDHCYGLPGILASAGMGVRKAPLTIVAPAGIKACLEAACEAACEAAQLGLPFVLEFIDSDELPSVELESMPIATLGSITSAP